MTNRTKIADDFRKIYDDIFKSEYIPEHIYDALPYELKDQILINERRINSVYHLVNNWFKYWNHVFNGLYHLDDELKDMDNETFQFLMNKLDEYKKERSSTMSFLKDTFKRQCDHIDKYSNQDIIDEL